MSTLAVSSLSPRRPSSSSSLRTGAGRTSSDGKLSATSSRNPISSRLYKILGTNYDDPAIKEALETLSELYSTPDDLRTAGAQSQSVKGKSVDREDTSTANRTEAEELDTLDAINAKAISKVVGSIPGSGIAARARKNLRRDAELKLTQGTQQFLSAFKEVDKKLDVLKEQIDAMHLQCDEAQTQLRSTNEACRSLLERAGGLRSARQTIQDQQLAVDSFLQHFTLTPEEVEVLQSRDIHINVQFFQIMRKAELVINDSRVLMSIEGGPSPAGIDIVTTTSQQLEQGYDKVARWCALEFRQFVRDALLEVTPLMIHAIKWLRKKPELLAEALSTLAATRQLTVLNGFTDALTRGGPGGLPRPIEIHAHDPLRYVGDMLAWVHQSIAGEREFLEALFEVRGERRMVGSVRRFDGSEEEVWIGELMDKVFEKVRAPLKTRIRQTVRSQESCIVSYKVANLLSFYNLTMRRTIGEKAGLSETLNEITNESYTVFFNTVEAQTRSLARTLQPSGQDLQPPISLLDHTQVLRELMSVYKSSLMGDESDEGVRTGFKPVLDMMVDAAVEMCSSVSESFGQQTQKGKEPWDKDVFLLNCLSHLVNTIRSYSFADYKVQELQANIDARADLLIIDHYAQILRDTSLYDCVDVCENKKSDEPISRIGAMQPDQLNAALQTFADWLSSSDVVHSSRLSALLDQRLADRVHHAALRKVASAYDRICEEVRKPENKYEAANTILGSQRPFGSLTTLRQVFGISEDE